MIYYDGKYVKQDINKAIHYYTLASNQNYSEAQYQLGLIYYPNNLKKSINYIMLASMNGNIMANFSHGFLLHEGKNLKRISLEQFIIIKKHQHSTINMQKIILELYTLMDMKIKLLKMYLMQLLILKKQFVKRMIFWRCTTWLIFTCMKIQ